MSFILDALKKSESDRQRQSGPSLFEVKVAPPRRTLPVWAVAIAVLLGINVVVVSWMLLRHAPAQEPAANAPAAAPAPARVAGTTASGETAAAPVTADVTAAAQGGAGRASARAQSPPPPVVRPGPSSAPASPAAGPGPLAAAAPPASPASRAPPGALRAAPAGTASDYAPAVEPPAARSPGASAPPGDALPLYQQVVAGDGLPPLHLDLHVYARNPKDRFVMINMHRLGEGDSLPNGVHVDSIRPDGVVLSYHGTQFLLPRD